MRNLPEEHDESIAFDEHSYERPPEEDDEDSSEEGYGSSSLVPLEEESERPLQPDHEGQAGEEEYLEQKRAMGEKFGTLIDQSGEKKVEHLIKESKYFLTTTIGRNSKNTYISYGQQSFIK